MHADEWNSLLRQMMVIILSEVGVALDAWVDVGEWGGTDLVQLIFVQ